MDQLLSGQVTDNLGAACQFRKVRKGELRNWGNWALHLCHTRLVLSIDTLGNGNHLVRLEMEMG